MTDQVYLQRKLAELKSDSQVFKQHSENYPNVIKMPLSEAHQRNISPPTMMGPNRIVISSSNTGYRPGSIEMNRRPPSSSLLYDEYKTRGGSIQPTANRNISNSGSLNVQTEYGIPRSTANTSVSGKSSSIYEQLLRKLEPPQKGPSSKEMAKMSYDRMPMDAPRYTNNSEFLDITERHEKDHIVELTAKYEKEVENNKKIAYEVNNLKQELEAELRKTSLIEEKFKQELKMTKIKETETLEELGMQEKKSAELANQIRNSEEELQYFKNELEKLKLENDKIYQETIRINDLTNEKVSEIEENIGNVNKMREFEFKNFEMEKDNILNTGEFVVEQIKIKFGEKIKDIEDQLRSVVEDKERFSNEAKAYVDQMRVLNSQTDNKFKAITARIKEEQDQKAETELNEFKAKISKSQNEMSFQQKRNTELIARFESIEREAKFRLSAQREENAKLRDELVVLEQEYNGLLVSINSEEKEAEKRERGYLKIDSEIKGIKAKSAQMEKQYLKSLEELKNEHRRNIEDIDKQLRTLEAEENSIQNKIKQANSITEEANRKYETLIHGLKNNLNVTLDQAIPDFGDRSYVL